MPGKKRPKKGGPKPAGPEPKDAPKARVQEFLEERATRMIPRKEKGKDKRPAPVDDKPSDAGSKNAGSELSDQRLKELRKYRDRLRAQRKERDRIRKRPGGGEPPQPPDTPPANNWIPIGPSVMRQGQGAVLPAVSGRTPAIAVATGGNRIYVGAANGGVWRSEDTGRTWRSLMDAFDLNPTLVASDSLAVGAIALVEGATAATDRLYVGSGEGAGGKYFGVGPLLSIDGGANWTTEATAPGGGSLSGTAFYALSVDPGDTDRVVAGSRNGIYRREPDGVGGFHWARKTLPSVLAGQWVTGVVAARTGGVTTFYASPWFGDVFSSTDGDTWTSVGVGFPTANVGRIGLAVRPTDPSVVYALVHYSGAAADPLDDSVLGVWRLDTTDNNWRQVTGHPADLFGTAAIGFQGNYDLAIAVDPNNVDRLYLGGSTRSSAGEWSGCLYRSMVTSAGMGAGLTYSMGNTYIGASVHADIHTLVFAPGDSDKLWCGCDGGVYYSTTPTGAGNIFQALNTGLQTLTMNHLDSHPTEDAVVFCGTQDNGGTRFTGEEVWLHSSAGDSGFHVVNWNDPYRVLSSYVRGSIRRTTDGGTRYNYAGVNVPLPGAADPDQVLFYAPVVGTPRNPAQPAEAERVAFGSNRPWISGTFGGGWVSIPSNTTADRLGAALGFRIRAMAFASHTRLYVGTMNGEVHRYDEAAAVWTRTRIDNVGGANILPFAVPITDIAVDPADATGASIYITYGGNGDYRHVWHFDGTQWEQRSGPAATLLDQLLDVQHTAVVCDPMNPATLYVGADIGVWGSTNSGTTWAPMSEGLPDAGVMDLQLHNGRRLLRVATHGRSVFERSLAAGPFAGIELYVRDTQLDQGRFTTVNNLPNPALQGDTVRHWRGPDIKVDTPDDTGTYQFPLTGDIDMYEFVEVLSDDFQNVATHATETIVSRVYVHVHNRGVTTADQVRVMLLLANASAGLPPLPAGFATNVQNGTTITTPNWRTVGMVALDDVRVGFPKIAAFNLGSDLLPPPASLPSQQHQCVLALLHHASDQFTNATLNTDDMSRGERKAAHKNLKVVQFTGTLPPAAPMMEIVHLYNPSSKKPIRSDVVLRLGRFKGRIRIVLPSTRVRDGVHPGLKKIKMPAPFTHWSARQVEFVKKQQAGDNPFDGPWAKRQIADINVVRKSGAVFEAAKRETVTLSGVNIPADGYVPLFVMINRPRRSKPGESFRLDIQQFEQGKPTAIGGLELRVELVGKRAKAKSVVG